MALTKENLAEALASTLNADKAVRSAAERYLTSVAPQPGFLSLLLQIAVLDSPEQSVPLAAAVQLKNYVNLNWSRTEDEVKALSDNLQKYFGTAKPFVLQAEDKQTVRDNVAEALALSQSKPARMVLCDVIRHIASSDFPNEWNGIVGQALDFIRTQQPMRMHAGLLILYHILDLNASSRKQERRDKLEPLVQHTFPLLFELLKALLGQDGNSFNGVLAHLVAKIFQCVIQYGIPALLMNEEVLGAWVELLAAVVQRNISDTPQDEDAARDHPWWKAKRHAMVGLHRLLDRYGSDSSPMEFKAITPVIKRPGGLAQKLVLPCAMWVLHKRFGENQLTPPAVICLALLIIETSVNHSLLFKDLKSELPALMSQVLLPLLMWQEAELLEWEADPEQFIASQNELAFSFERGSALSKDADSTIDVICHSRTRYALPLVLELANAYTNEYQANPDDFKLAHRQSGVIRAYTALWYTITKSEAINVEQVIMPQALFALKSKYAFLRYSACECIAKYFRITWSSEDIERQVGQSMLQCLGDADLVVRSIAAYSLPKLLASESKVMRSVAEGSVTDIVRTMLTLMQQVGNDALFSSLTAIIARFPSHILPLTKDVCRSILEAFFRIALEENEDDESFSEISASIECLSSLDTILSACTLDENNEDNKGREILWQTLPILVPLFNLVFSNAGISDFEEGDDFAKMAMVSALALYDGQQPPKVHLDLDDVFARTCNILSMVVYHSKKVLPVLWAYVPLLGRYAEITLLDYSSVFGLWECLCHYDPEGMMRPGVQGIKTFDVMLAFITKHNQRFLDTVAEAQEKEKNGKSGKDKFEHFTTIEAFQEISAEEMAFLCDADEDEINDKYDEASRGAFVLSAALQSSVGSGHLDDYVKQIVTVMMRSAQVPKDRPNAVVTFLNAIQSAIYYNPRLALVAIGQENIDGFISMAIEYLESNLATGEILIAMLAFVKILAISPSEMPPSVNARRRDMIQAVAALAVRLDNFRQIIATNEAKEKEERREAIANGLQLELDIGESDKDLDDMDFRHDGPGDVPEDEDINPPGFELSLSKNQSSSGLGEDDEDDEDFEEDDEDDEDYQDEDEVDEHDEGGTYPVDDVDECVFLFSAMAQAPQDAQSEFQAVLNDFQASNPEVANVLTKMISEGQRRATA